MTSLTILASALATVRLTGRLRPWQFGLARLQVARSLGWMAIALAGFVLTFAARGRALRARPGRVPRPEMVIA